MIVIHHISILQHDSLQLAADNFQQQQIAAAADCTLSRLQQQQKLAATEACSSISLSFQQQKLSATAALFCSSSSSLQ
jgi:hypothetical protein